MTPDTSLTLTALCWHLARFGVVLLAVFVVAFLLFLLMPDIAMCPANDLGCLA